MNETHPMTYKEYMKLSPQDKDRHHAKIREELIAQGLIKPQEAK